MSDKEIAFVSLRAAEIFESLFKDEDVADALDRIGDNMEEYFDEVRKWVAQMIDKGGLHEDQRAPMILLTALTSALCKYVTTDAHRAMVAITYAVAEKLLNEWLDIGIDEVLSRSRARKPKEFTE